MNAQGRADIILAPLYDPDSARDRALQAGRAFGFNALEQYTDDRALQVGPWTDVYSLCATCFRLITGSHPLSAIDRCVQERYVPLVELSPAGYDRRFLAAVDQGLALRPHDRPPSIVQLLILMGMDGDFAHRLRQADEAVASHVVQPMRSESASAATAAAAQSGAQRAFGSVDPVASGGGQVAVPMRRTCAATRKPAPANTHATRGLPPTSTPTPREAISASTLAPPKSPPVNSPAISRAQRFGRLCANGSRTYCGVCPHRARCPGYIFRLQCSWGFSVHCGYVLASESARRTSRPTRAQVLPDVPSGRGPPARRGFRAQTRLIGLDKPLTLKARCGILDG